jgi:hypothetical protein
MDLIEVLCCGVTSIAKWMGTPIMAKRLKSRRKASKAKSKLKAAKPKPSRRREPKTRKAAASYVRMIGTIRWTNDETDDEADITRAILRNDENELSISFYHDGINYDNCVLRRDPTTDIFHGPFTSIFGNHRGSGTAHCRIIKRSDEGIVFRGTWLEGYKYDWELDLTIVEKFDD